MAPSVSDALQSADRGGERVFIDCIVDKVVFVDTGRRVAREHETRLPLHGPLLRCGSPPYYYYYYSGGWPGAGPGTRR
jgi:hypothetical protein